MGEKKLEGILSRIDGKGYKAYKDLAGTYRIRNFTLFIDYVQGDPFASPSRIRIRVDQKTAGFPNELFDGRSRRIGFEDFITRAAASAIRESAKGNRGTGKSGLMAIQSCGQEMLERTSVVINKDFIEARLTIGLPAAGRRVLARQAREMLLAELPRVVDRSLLYSAVDREKLKRHVEMMEDQDFLRGKLDDMDIVCFIANGSVLPRESGISQRPMRDGAIPFVSPSSMKVEIELPNRGTVRGMGIKGGVTLIVGGGYHGKSTLLRAVERGVYNHIPGDGRELVVTCADAVKIRAEDGRNVEKVNISPFINNLPNGDDTVEFSTQNASGSTSQAANIIEALELGAGALLLDEDTSATNFMIRDGRMQELVAKDKEPITPFIDRIRQLYSERGVSTVLVVGGSGDYFEVADSVVMMDNYRPLDVTDRAREIAAANRAARHKENAGSFGGMTERKPMPAGRMDDRRFKVKVKGMDTILYGREAIDLAFVEQLVDFGQTNAIAEILKYMQRYVDGKRPLKSVLDKVLEDIQNEGIDVVSPFRGHPGELALPRIFEMGAAVNRLRSARFFQ